MSVEEQKQSPEHHALQARCVNVPNDEPEGHYWSWVNAPQSIPNQYRECMSCGRIDATEWLESRNQQIALAARIDEPKPNTKEYLKLHSVKQPYTVHDIGYMEQLIRYHESIAAQLRKEINQLREK
jgi:hypothetical protein